MLSVERQLPWNTRVWLTLHRATQSAASLSGPRLIVNMTGLAILDANSSRWRRYIGAKWADADQR
jgi:hypothetical protein